jgi:hypothetical protein
MDRNVVLDPSEKSHLEDGRIRSGGGLVVFFVGGNRFQVFGFKDLVAIQAADIIHPVAPRQNLGTTVIAGLHKWRLNPF